MKTFHREITTLAVALLAATTGSAQSFDHEAAETLPPGVVKQDDAAARAADLATLARETGASEQAVGRALTFQESFTEYARDLLARYPDQISRIWLEPAPAIGAHVQFTDRVPAEVAPRNVRLTGDGVVSLAEHYRRAELAAAALKDGGYRNFATFFDATLGATRIEMSVDESATAPSQDAVFELVRERVWMDRELSGEALVVEPSDLDLRILRGAGEIYTEEHSRGGNWLRDDGFRECTSGWAVSGPNGDGIITAAHCVGLNQFEQPGVPLYGMTWRDQERGVGDAEYHTTTHIEPAEFYANATSIRDTRSVRSTFLMFPGNAVCVYGRSSNIRSCAHNIEAINVTVTFSDGVTVNNLARASGDTSIGGDSGGGWSFNTEAWGVHSGSNDVVSYFTPVQTAEGMLGVRVKLQP